VQGKFSSLTKRNGAHVTAVRLASSVNVFVLFDVLGQTEVLVAVLARQLFFQVVLVVVPLQAELSLENLATVKHVALEELFAVVLLLVAFFFFIIFIFLFLH